MCGNFEKIKNMWHIILLLSKNVVKCKDVAGIVAKIMQKTTSGDENNEGMMKACGLRVNINIYLA